MHLVSVPSSPVGQSVWFLWHLLNGKQMRFKGRVLELPKHWLSCHAVSEPTGRGS